MKRYLVATVTERYEFDPAQLAESHGITTEDEVIDFFTQHDGSLYIGEFFHHHDYDRGIEFEEVEE